MQEAIKLEGKEFIRQDTEYPRREVTCTRCTGASSDYTGRLQDGNFGILHISCTGSRTRYKCRVRMKVQGEGYTEYDDIEYAEDKDVSFSLHIRVDILCLNTLY